jgi:hypothetical protein
MDASKTPTARRSPRWHNARRRDPKDCARRQRGWNFQLDWEHGSLRLAGRAAGWLSWSLSVGEQLAAGDATGWGVKAKAKAKAKQKQQQKHTQKHAQKQAVPSIRARATAPITSCPFTTQCSRPHLTHCDPRRCCCLSAPRNPSRTATFTELPLNNNSRRRREPAPALATNRKLPPPSAACAF